MHSPSEAVRESIDVLEGDIILVATDGLFDNMTDSMILRHLRIVKVRCTSSPPNSLACPSCMIYYVYNGLWQECLGIKTYHSLFCAFNWENV